MLFFALLVAVAASTAIGYFGARLNGAMQLRASEFLGADLVLQGGSPARDKQISAGKAAGLQHAHVVEFTSVVGGDSGIQLSSIKAADAAYPLRGQLRSAATPYAEETLAAARTWRSLGRGTSTGGAGAIDWRQHRRRHEDLAYEPCADLRTRSRQQLL